MFDNVFLSWPIDPSTGTNTKRINLESLYPGMRIICHQGAQKRMMYALVVAICDDIYVGAKSVWLLYESRLVQVSRTDTTLVSTLC